MTLLLSDLLKKVAKNQTNLALIFNESNILFEVVVPETVNDVNKSFYNYTTTTTHQQTNLTRTTNLTKKSNSRVSEDTAALWYMIVVIVFYGLVVFLVLVIRVKPKKRDASESDRKLAESLVRGIRDQSVYTRSILEQLKDREYRAKAWDIYVSGRRRDSRSLQTFRQSLLLKETDVLKRIEKQIEVIERRSDFLARPDLNSTRFDENCYGARRHSLDENTRPTYDASELKNLSLRRSLTQFRRSFRSRFTKPSQKSSAVNCLKRTTNNRQMNRRYYHTVPSHLWMSEMKRVSKPHLDSTSNYSSISDRSQQYQQLGLFHISNIETNEILKHTKI